MGEDVKEIELAAGTKISGDKIDYIVLKAGFKYPLPEKKTEDPATLPAAEPAKDGTPAAPAPAAAPAEPPKPDGDTKPVDAALTTEMKSDIEEVKIVKDMLAKKILQAELTTTPELKVEDRMAELMKLKLNDLTKLLPKTAPDAASGEGYATDMALSQGANKKDAVVNLRTIVEAGIEGGVL